MSVGKKLGVAYDTDKQSELPTCCLKVTPDNISLTGGTQSVLKFDGVNGYKEMAMELDLDLSVHAKILSVKVDASISLTTSIQETDYTKSFIFNINAQLPNARLILSSYGTDALTPAAAMLYQVSPKQFREVCGDRFVLQENLGASLYISTKLDFMTRTEKATFSIHSNWLLSGVMAYFKLLVGSKLKIMLTQQRVTFSIAVLQKGGDQSLLDKAVPELNLQDGIGKFECIKSSDKHDIDNKVKACEAILTKLLDYAASTFPASIENNNFDLSETLSYYRADYKVLGLKTGPSLITAHVEEIRKYIHLLYTDLQSKQEFLGKLLQPMPVGQNYMNIGDVQVGWNYTNIGPDSLQQLYIANATITTALKNILALDTVCYDDPLSCRNFTDSLDLHIVQMFERAYVIKTKCDDTIYGPRYILPVNQDFYIEDSIFKIAPNMTKNFVLTYQMVPHNNGDSLAISFQDCAVSLNRDTTYDLIDAYNGDFHDNCAQILCPVPISGNTVEAEFILTETPI